MIHSGLWKFLLATSVICAGIAGYQVAYLFTRNSTDTSVHIILVEPGPLQKTAEMLAREKLIHHPRRFSIWGRLLGYGSKIRVGEYEISSNATPLEILQKLVSGKVLQHLVHIPEGFEIDQIAQVLAAKNLGREEDFIRLMKDPRMAKMMGIEERSLEGYLYPETYAFTRFTGERAVIKAMVDKFKEIYEKEIAPLAEKQGRTMHEVVTLASVIEKETGAPEERSIISSVFHNRLRLNMPLQSDPTVIYGKAGDRKNITRKDLQTPSPFNTYTRKGLPAGPISNPGRAALLAAVTPAETKFLYFVSKNNGTHEFTEKYSDHSKAVSKFQLDRKAREGKSWRDLKKRKK